jgi:hypothetical protein
LAKQTSDAAGALNDEHSRAADRVRNVFVSVLRVEDVANTKPMDAFDAILACVHFYFPVKHDEDFGPVIDVPFVRLISPMEAYGDLVDSLDIQRRPCFGADERIWNKSFAFADLPSILR